MHDRRHLIALTLVFGSPLHYVRSPPRALSSMRWDLSSEGAAWLPLQVLARHVNLGSSPGTRIVAIHSFWRCAKFPRYGHAFVVRCDALRELALEVLARGATAFIGVRMRYWGGGLVICRSQPVHHPAAQSFLSVVRSLFAYFSQPHVVARAGGLSRVSLRFCAPSSLRQYASSSLDSVLCVLEVGRVVACPYLIRRSGSSDFDTAGRAPAILGRTPSRVVSNCLGCFLNFTKIRDRAPDPDDMSNHCGRHPRTLHQRGCCGECLSPPRRLSSSRATTKSWVVDNDRRTRRHFFI